MPRRRTFPLYLATMLLALAGLPGLARATSIDSFSVRPVQFNPRDPATRAYFKVTENPGNSFTRQVLVSNGGKRPLRLLVYTVDGLTGVTSGAVYGNREDLLNRAGHWLRPAVDSITVAPNAARRIFFTVAVPTTATPGDHLAGIAFEDMAERTTPGRFSVREVFRIVVGVEIRVPGAAAPQLQLTGASISPLPGTNRASIVIGLRNAGRLLCKPWLTVFVQGAGRARVVTRQLDTLLPGDAIPYPFAWPATLTSGHYQVRIGGTRCGTSVRLASTLNSARPLIGQQGRQAPWQPAEIPPAPAVTSWAIAAAGGAGLAAGALLAAFALLAVRRRSPTAAPASAGSTP